jgi:DNA-directed RNA polymerase specialized sigma24 family protein
MRYGEGLSAAVIAGRLDRSADAVYQSLSRIHRCLRECVERRLEASKQPTREAPA